MLFYLYMDNGSLIPISKKLGAILLIVGSCIGAGMLGLPVLSAKAGFLPSIFMFMLAWGFMLSTGLLLVEANLWYQEDVNIITIAGRTLGFIGKLVAWGVFLFLFYSLMVAYCLGSSELFQGFFENYFSIHLPLPFCGFIMIAIFGLMVFLGSGAVVGFNRLLMLGLILSYFLLVMMGNSHIEKKHLEHVNWLESFFVMPAMIVSFGFHNLIPSVTHYLKRDGRSIAVVLAVGSFIPLLIYLVWQRLILGIVPLDSVELALSEGQTATSALRSAVGVSWIVDVAEAFAFFAIVTSFLGVAFSFVDFLSDGLKIPKTSTGTAFLCVLSLLPPYLFSIYYPGAFLSALNYAGGFGAVIIFGILPALIVWTGRYVKKMQGRQYLPGGKASLAFIILFSFTITLIQAYQAYTG